MNFMELLEKRCSCRAYLDKPVSRDDLIKIVSAARLSPSGCNAQPWKFMIVDESEAKEKLCDALVVSDGITGARWRYEVPAFIVAVEQPAKVMPAVIEHFGSSQRFALGDIGMAVMNMCYEAMDLGLNTCIIGLFDQKKMEDHFGIPEEMECRYVLAVGYGNPDIAPRKKVRKNLNDIYTLNKWT